MVIDHDGLTTFVEVEGPADGRAIVLVHGLGGDHEMFREQVGPLTEAGLRVVVPDMLAHGASSKVERLELDDWSHQLDVVTDHLGLRTYALAGVSMGGVIAQHHAVRRADRITALATFDTFSDLRTPATRMQARSQVLALPIMRVFGHRVLAALMVSPYKAPHTRVAREYLHARMLEGDVGQLLLARKAINRVHVLDRLDEVRCPALVAVGDGFGSTFVELNREIAEHLPRARFEVIGDSMDPSPLVQPGRVTELLLELLAPDSPTQDRDDC